MDENNSLHSGFSLGAGSSTFSFEIRLAGDGSRRLVIDESQPDRHSSIIVPEEYWEEFSECMRQALTSARKVNESLLPEILAGAPIFEKLDRLVNDAYGKRTRIKTLLENTGLDPIQSGQVLERFSEEVSAVIMENFRSFLQTRQNGDLLWKLTIDRYGLSGAAPETYQGIAEKWKITAEKTRQLVEQALRRLRLQQRRRRLESSLQAHAETWLGVRLSEKPGEELSMAAEKKLPEHIVNTRKIYPRAFEPWTAEEDGKLLALHQDGYPVDELAEHFGRQPGAVRAHLKKLSEEGV